MAPGLPPYGGLWTTAATPPRHREALISWGAVQGSSGHPASGIVVDDAGQVYFLHTGVGIWKIDGAGRVHRVEGPGHHFLALDPDGAFIDQDWPRYREEFRPGLFRRYGDGVIEPVGTSPTLITASSFPIAIGPDGAIYYPEPEADERVHIKRLPPSKRPSDFATLPEAIEVNPDFELQKVPWIHGLAAGPDGTLYYAEKDAVRRIGRDGTVSVVAEDLMIPDCVHGPERSTSRPPDVPPSCRSRQTGQRACRSDPRALGRLLASQ